MEHVSHWSFLGFSLSGTGPFYYMMQFYFFWPQWRIGIESESPRLSVMQYSAMKKTVLFSYVVLFQEKGICLTQELPFSFHCNKGVPAVGWRLSHKKMPRTTRDWFMDPTGAKQQREILVTVREWGHVGVTGRLDWIIQSFGHQDQRLDHSVYG